MKQKNTLTAEVIKKLTEDAKSATPIEKKRTSVLDPVYDVIMDYRRAGWPFSKIASRLHEIAGLNISSSYLSTWTKSETRRRKRVQSRQEPQAQPTSSPKRVGTQPRKKFTYNSEKPTHEQ